MRVTSKKYVSNTGFRFSTAQYKYNLKALEGLTSCVCVKGKKANTVNGINWKRAKEMTLKLFPGNSSDVIA